MVDLASGEGIGATISSLLPLAIMFMIFYFLLIRPQQKRQRERNQMLAAVAKGDKIVTIGGIHGTVLDVYEKTVVVRIAENTKVTLDRQAVGNVIKGEATTE